MPEHAHPEPRSVDARRLPTRDAQPEAQPEQAYRSNAAILRLQRSIGNQGVARLLSRQVRPPASIVVPAAPQRILRLVDDVAIKKRAAEIWEQKGKPPQDQAASDADWAEAKRQLEKEHAEQAERAKKIYDARVAKDPASANSTEEQKKKDWEQAGKELAHEKRAYEIYERKVKADPSKKNQSAEEQAKDWKQAGEELQQEGANPVAPPDAGTVAHADLKSGDRGIAVQELQQKLTHALAVCKVEGHVLASDGIFGPLTQAAVKAYQKHHGLPETGEMKAAEWKLLDAQGKSTVGEVKKKWSENLAGKTYGMTSRFTWEIQPDKVKVRVPFKVVWGPGTTGSMAPYFGGIKRLWNAFKLVHRFDPAQERDLEFDPYETGDGVQVKMHAGSGRSDAGNWYEGDARLVNETSAHEFGHMIGLEDEYERQHADYRRVTNTDPDKGAANAGNAATIAAQIQTDLTTGTPQQSGAALMQTVIWGGNITEGEFAGQVADAYEALTGHTIFQDVNARLTGALQVNLNGTNYPIDSVRSWIVGRFTASSKSLMGRGQKVKPYQDRLAAGEKSAEIALHDHPVEPRHVREYVSIMEQNVGGKWKAVYK